MTVIQYPPISSPPPSSSSIPNDPNWLPSLSSYLSSFSSPSSFGHLPFHLCYDILLILSHLLDISLQCYICYLYWIGEYKIHFGFLVSALILQSVGIVVMSMVQLNIEGFFNFWFLIPFSGVLPAVISTAFYFRPFAKKFVIWRDENRKFVLEEKDENPEQKREINGVPSPFPATDILPSITSTPPTVLSSSSSLSSSTSSPSSSSLSSRIASLSPTEHLSPQYKAFSSTLFGRLVLHFMSDKSHSIFTSDNFLDIYAEFKELKTIQFGGYHVSFIFLTSLAILINIIFVMNENHIVDPTIFVSILNALFLLLLRSFSVISTHVTQWKCVLNVLCLLADTVCVYLLLLYLPFNNIINGNHYITMVQSSGDLFMGTFSLSIWSYIWFISQFILLGILSIVCIPLIVLGVFVTYNYDLGVVKNILGVFCTLFCCILGFSLVIPTCVVLLNTLRWNLLSFYFASWQPMSASNPYVVPFMRRIYDFVNHNNDIMDKRKKNNDLLSSPSSSLNGYLSFPEIFSSLSEHRHSEELKFQLESKKREEERKQKDEMFKESIAIQQSEEGKTTVRNGGRMQPRTVGTPSDVVTVYDIQDKGKDKEENFENHYEKKYSIEVTKNDGESLHTSAPSSPSHFLSSSSSSSSSSSFSSPSSLIPRFPTTPSQLRTWKLYIVNRFLAEKTLSRLPPPCCVNEEQKKVVYYARLITEVQNPLDPKDFNVEFIENSQSDDFSKQYRRWRREWRELRWQNWRQNFGDFAFFVVVGSLIHCILPLTILFVLFTSFYPIIVFADYLYRTPTEYVFTMQHGLLHSILALIYILCIVGIFIVTPIVSHFCFFFSGIHGMTLGNNFFYLDYFGHFIESMRKDVGNKMGRTQMAVTMGVKMNRDNDGDNDSNGGNVVKEQKEEKGKGSSNELKDENESQEKEFSPPDDSPWPTRNGELLCDHMMPLFDESLTARWESESWTNRLQDVKPRKSKKKLRKKNTSPSPLSPSPLSALSPSNAPFATSMRPPPPRLSNDEEESQSLEEEEEDPNFMMIRPDDKVITKEEMYELEYGHGRRNRRRGGLIADVKEDEEEFTQDEDEDLRNEVEQKMGTGTGRRTWEGEGSGGGGAEEKERGVNDDSIVIAVNENRDEKKESKEDEKYGEEKNSDQPLFRRMLSLRNHNNDISTLTMLSTPTTTGEKLEDFFSSSSLHSFNSPHYIRKDPIHIWPLRMALRFYTIQLREMTYYHLTHNSPFPDALCNIITSYIPKEESMEDIEDDTFRNTIYQYFDREQFRRNESKILSFLTRRTYLSGYPQSSMVIISCKRVDDIVKEQRKWEEKSLYSSHQFDMGRLHVERKSDTDTYSATLSDFDRLLWLCMFRRVNPSLLSSLESINVTHSSPSIKPFMFKRRHSIATAHHFIRNAPRVLPSPSGCQSPTFVFCISVPGFSNNMVEMFRGKQFTIHFKTDPKECNAESKDKDSKDNKESVSPSPSPLLSLSLSIPFQILSADSLQHTRGFFGDNTRFQGMSNLHTKTWNPLMNHLVLQDELKRRGMEYSFDILEKRQKKKIKKDKDNDVDEEVEEKHDLGETVWDPQVKYQ